MTAIEASSYFEADGAIVKTGASLKSIHFKQIGLAQIHETHCILNN